MNAFFLFRGLPGRSKNPIRAALRVTMGWEGRGLKVVLKLFTIEKENYKSIVSCH